MAKPKLKRVVRKRREKKLVERGAADIRSSCNNTILTITDTAGNAMSWASDGGLGFRGSKNPRRSPSKTAAETAQGRDGVRPQVG
jgi:small subunit ribosomal protein S11